MIIKLNEMKLKTISQMIIPFCIFIAIEGTFSIQSIIIPIMLLVFADIFFSKKKIINSQSIITIFMFITSMVMSFIINLLTNNYITIQSSIRIIYFLIIIYFYYSATNIKYSPKAIERIIKSNIYAGTLVSLYLIFINHIWFYSLLKIKIDKNFVAAILVIQAQLAIILFFKINYKIKYFIFFIIICLGIFYSASRAAVLMAIFGSLITLFFILKNQKKNKINRRVNFLIIIIGISFFVFLFYKLRSSNLNSSVMWYWNRYFINGFGDESVTGRWVWWKNALELFSMRPFFGYGIGNINVSGNSSAVAHNTFIDFLLDQGLCGFLAYILIIFSILKKIVKKNNNIYLGITISLFLLTFILSATKSTLLWYSLVLLTNIGKVGSEDGDIVEKINKNKE